MSINGCRASRHLHKTMVSTMIKSRHKDKAKLFSFVTLLGKYRLGHYMRLDCMILVRDIQSQDLYRSCRAFLPVFRMVGTFVETGDVAL